MDTKKAHAVLLTLLRHYCVAPDTLRLAMEALDTLMAAINGKPADEQ